MINDFPILRSPTNGKRLIYLDNAATSQKPVVVLRAMDQFFQKYNANVHRGIHGLSESATTLYEQARNTVAQFLGAQSHEIVFTAGCTMGINFIAYAWAMHTLQPGDEIVLTELEHHANILPWQYVAQKTGAVLKYIPVTDEGVLRYDLIEHIITPRTKLVSCVHVSNALGTHNDITFIIKAAQHIGARILLDAAQSIGHEPVNVRNLDVDFLVFSGHKVLGPTGVGVLYIAERAQHEVTPFMRGGGMVQTVGFYDATFAYPPYCFEAGTPPVAEAIGLAAALEYVGKLKINLITHEARLCATLIDGLNSMPKFCVIGPQDQLKKQGHIVSFVHDTLHPHDIAAKLDDHNIAVRAGNHCTQPLFAKLGIHASVRASTHLYNTQEDIIAVLQVLESL